MKAGTFFPPKISNSQKFKPSVCNAPKVLALLAANYPAHISREDKIKATAGGNTRLRVPM